MPLSKKPLACAGRWRPRAGIRPPWRACAWSWPRLSGGAAFALDSAGTMVTNKHILVGDDGTKTPRRLGVIFSGSTQFWRAEMVGVSPESDVGVFRVSIKGGTPRVAGLARTREGLERGDPVAILGYPLGFDLPMESQGGQPIAEPTLTVGTVSKALTAVVQVDAY